MPSALPPLGRAAITLLLAALESPSAALSAATLKCYPAEADSLKAALLIKHAASEPATVILDDHSDAPIQATWSADDDGYGYFSDSRGWVSVSSENIASFSVDLPVFLAALTHNLQLPKSPVSILEDHLWDLGAARLPGRVKRSPVLFGRRLHDRAVWTAAEAALRKRPSVVRRTVLTSTPSDMLPDSLAGSVVVSINDVLGVERSLDIDPAVLSLRLGQLPVLDSQQPIAILADGKEVHFLGQVFRFPRGIHQRAVIRFLYDQYLAGQLWTSSELILESLDDVSPKTRLRDLFKGNRAWNRLLTERAGMCGFCFPDHDPDTDADKT
jgi:hypothetical protein